MNPYLAIILAALAADFALGNVSRFLDIRALGAGRPEELDGIYDAETYAKAQKYTKSKTSFGFVTSTFNLALVLVFIFAGIFNSVDLFARSASVSGIVRGLIFFAVLYFIKDVLSAPLSLWSNFKIEKKYGFNRMTLKTFFLDKIKSWFILAVLGSVFLGGILWFFAKAGSRAWLYAWALSAAFTVLLQPLYNSVIAPIFNRFSPLEDGEMKSAVESYLKKADFPVGGIYVMDGSRRSSHSNAYFSGFGKNRRIVLFDTLLKKHSTGEIVSIIAHETGHYKKGHIIKGMAISVLHSGVIFYLMSLLIGNRRLFDAFGMENVSVYAGLVFFMFLWRGAELFISPAMSALSRKFEKEADAFAVKTCGSAGDFVSALKALSSANLANLTPHPFTVFLKYSHPPVLDRIRAVRAATPAKNQ